jgi:hypothetical protein
MSEETPKDIDRAAIAEHAQRLAEQAALRKVRKTLDQIEQDKTGERRLLRKVLFVCALLAVLGAWYFWELLFGGSSPPKQPPAQVPGMLQQKQ